MLVGEFTTWSSLTDAKRIAGRLRDNPELIERARARAKAVADLEPVRRQVDGDHWVFVQPRRSASPSSADASDPAPVQRRGEAQ